MSLHDKIVKAVNRARTAWAVMMGVAAIFTFSTAPNPWMWALLIPFGVISYMVTLAVVAFMLSGNVTEEDLKEAEAKQDSLDVEAKRPNIPPETKKFLQDVGLKPDQVSLHDIAVVSKTGPEIGMFKDKPIYEFIRVKVPGATKTDKLMYHGPAVVKDGQPEIPVVDGMIYALVEGVLYAKGQPVKE